MNTLSYFSSQILIDLQTQISEGSFSLDYDVGKYFVSLREQFPMSGTDIDWKLIGGETLNTKTKANSVGEFSDFFKTMTSEFSQECRVIYIADGPLDFALLGALKKFLLAIPEIVKWPMHHYFFFTDDKFSWCVSLRITGEMAFGVLPQKS